ncbi:DHS-like NAD/FAD-binding domain-containing protein [Lobosporangium transversale]|uniref:DHS-like NAD/FAD-binding domain-containing protein n=1 Tax=Lobosporangium transversale TaxID=64571 RepID=A0A1Y2H1Q3_9FUNG|nr:DHS-like NAD/FAD-binding domain-containing protein [Lobosporangium transversale]ORZ28465.1 DHS-like NAD/FAD-binding domain-containing protein [Lobosporangium transversale]|eukprot:XP_021886150.1 DHS-like NAD/FAD-binding domain-containing protein [Lobosporangium transversale]
MLTIDLNQSDVVSERHLQTVTDVMLRAKKTIVVTGAGISCSSGIPDFRSADGLYNLVKKQYPKTVLKGKDLFDANLFRDCTTTAVFYTFISELHAQTLKAKPSPTHHFIKMLSEKGKLLRCYTQNIDCLEEELGMETKLVCEKGKVKKDVNVVQLHGSLRKLKCTLCSEPYGFITDYEKVFREGEAPDCPKCELNDGIRVAQGKRKIATGTLRPDIVLYNENHPFGEAIGRIQLSDFQKSPDVLLVMGTSLKVHGLRLLVRKAAKIVHANKKGCVILVNKTPVVGKEWNGVFDYFIEGECDHWCHIVQDALRKVKVQTKLPFKPLTTEQMEKQKQAQKEEKQEQEQSSDKENFIPLSLYKKQKPGSRKRPFAAMMGK